MRKLKLEDVGRFCYFVKTAKAKSTINDILEMVAGCIRERKNTLAELQAKADSGDTEAALALAAEQKDDDWTIIPGIRGFMMLTDCAAESGAMEALYKFLAPVWEMKPDEVKEMELEAVLEKVQEMLRMNNMKSFFGAARKMGM